MFPFLTFATLFASLSVCLAEEPERLNSLRSSYHREVSRVTEPVKRKYQTALASMKDSYTKGGDLNAALAVEKELKLLSGDFSAWLQTVNLHTTNGFVYHFDGTHLVEINNGVPGLKSKRVQMINSEERSLDWEWPDGQKRSLVLLPNLKHGIYLMADGNHKVISVQSRKP